MTGWFVRPRRAAVQTWVLVLGLALPAAAQIARTPQAPPAPAAPAATADPYGRNTPRGTITGLGQAVNRNDPSAVRYLQVTAAQRAQAEQLARDLSALVERYFRTSLATLSDDPEGVTTDGLPLDRERMVLTIGDSTHDIVLVRVKDRQAGLIWLVSSQSVAQIRGLYDSAGRTWLERLMPQRLADSKIFGMSVATLVAWAATLALPFAALWLLSLLFIAIARLLTRRATRNWRDGQYARIRWPTIVLLTLVIHGGLVRLLGFSLRFRSIYGRILLVAAVAAAAWLMWRVMAMMFAHARGVATRRGHSGVESLLRLAERVCKSLLVMLAIFAALTIAGVDTATALAGLGIGGVAVALGAQKSVENLLGGIFLLSDRALAVGDFCTISDRQGVIEDITMRSVRLRTLEQTLLSVPTGVVSQASLENFATRHKILIQSTLRLRYGTTTDQLRWVLNRIQALLDERPEVETETARIRLHDFGARAIELELFAYVRTPDWLKFLAIREDLLLQVATIIESSGTGFAQPVVFDDRALAVAKHPADHGEEKGG